MTKELSDMTLQELWELFPIYLTPHKSVWVEMFEQESAIISSVLPKDSNIYHIGSTAIDGIWAKPIIDILVELDEKESLKDIAERLQDLHYIIMSSSGRRVSLNKGYTVRGFADKVFHLHLRYRNDRDEVYFRDYLNIDAEAAKEYEKLKLSLCKLFEHDRDGYTQAKTEFVKKYTQIAKNYFNVNNSK